MTTVRQYLGVRGLSNLVMPDACSTGTGLEVRFAAKSVDYVDYIRNYRVQTEQCD